MPIVTVFLFDFGARDMKRCFIVALNRCSGPLITGIFVFVSVYSLPHFIPHPVFIPFFTNTVRGQWLAQRLHISFSNFMSVISQMKPELDIPASRQSRAAPRAPVRWQ
ncbi:hypothetical protein ES703_81601 [subsurface metagenome]